MSVDIRLNAEQSAFFVECMNKSKVPYLLNGNSLSITAESFPAYLAALKAAHAKAMLLKVKKFAAMEKLYNLEQLIYRIEETGVYFIDLNDGDAEVTTEDALMAAILAANSEDANPDDQEIPVEA